MRHIVIILFVACCGSASAQIDLRQLLPDSMQYMIPITDSLLENEYYQKYHKLAQPHLFTKTDSICYVLYEGGDTSCVPKDLMGLDTLFWIDYAGDSLILVLIGDTVNITYPEPGVGGGGDTTYYWWYQTDGGSPDSVVVGEGINFVSGTNMNITQGATNLTFDATDTETDIDSAKILGTVLHIYEDDKDRSVELSGLLDSVGLQSLIVSNGVGSDTLFLTYRDGTKKDTVVLYPPQINDIRLDSIGLINAGDSIPFYIRDSSGIVDTLYAFVPSDSIDTDSQSLSLIANILAITRGNSVDLTPYLDNDTIYQTIIKTGQAVLLSDANPNDTIADLEEEGVVYWKNGEWATDSANFHYSDVGRQLVINQPNYETNPWKLVVSGGVMVKADTFTTGQTRLRLKEGFTTDYYDWIVDTDELSLETPGALTDDAIRIRRGTKSNTLKIDSTGVGINIGTGWLNHDFVVGGDMFLTNHYYDSFEENGDGDFSVISRVTAGTRWKTFVGTGGISLSTNGMNDSILIDGSGLLSNIIAFNGLTNQSIDSIKLGGQLVEDTRIRGNDDLPGLTEYSIYFDTLKNYEITASTLSRMRKIRTPTLSNNSGYISVGNGSASAFYYDFDANKSGRLLINNTGAFLSNGDTSNVASRNSISLLQDSLYIKPGNQVVPIDTGYVLIAQDTLGRALWQHKDSLDLQDYDFIKLQGDTLYAGQLIDTLLPNDSTDLLGLIYHRGRVRIGNPNYYPSIYWNGTFYENFVLDQDSIDSGTGLQIYGKRSAIDIYHLTRPYIHIRNNLGEFYHRVYDPSGEVGIDPQEYQIGTVGRWYNSVSETYDTTDRAIFTIGDDSDARSLTIFKNYLQSDIYRVQDRNDTLRTDSLYQLLTTDTYGNFKLVKMDTVAAKLGVIAAGSVEIDTFFLNANDSLGLDLTGTVAPIQYVDLSKFNVSVSGDSIYQGGVGIPLPEGSDSLGTSGTSGEVVVRSGGRGATSFSTFTSTSTSTYMPPTAYIGYADTTGGSVLFVGSSTTDGIATIQLSGGAFVNNTTLTRQSGINGNFNISTQGTGQFRNYYATGSYAIDNINGSALNFNSSRRLTLNAYTGTTFDATPTKILNVDASGNVQTTTSAALAAFLGSSVGDSLGRNGTAGRIVFETATKAPNSTANLVWSSANQRLEVGGTSGMNGILMNNNNFLGVKNAAGTVNVRLAGIDGSNHTYLGAIDNPIVTNAGSLFIREDGANRISVENGLIRFDAYAMGGGGTVTPAYFLITDAAGNVKQRTGAQVLTDIGADPSSGNEIQTISVGARTATSVPIDLNLGGGTAPIPVFSSLLAGLVPAPNPAGTTRYLKENGTWDTPTTSGGGIYGGSGTVPAGGGTPITATIGDDFRMFSDGVYKLALGSGLTTALRSTSGASVLVGQDGDEMVFYYDAPTGETRMRAINRGISTYFRIGDPGGSSGLQSNGAISFVGATSSMSTTAGVLGLAANGSIDATATDDISLQAEDDLYVTAGVDAVDNVEISAGGTATITSGGTTTITSGGTTTITPGATSNVIFEMGTHDLYIGDNGTSGVWLGNAQVTGGGSTADGLSILLDHISIAPNNQSELDVYTDRVEINSGISGTYNLEVSGTAGKSNGSNLWDSPSDRRFKDRFEEIKNPIDKIMELKPTHFHYNQAYRDKYEMDDHRLVGYIAQEYREIFPDDVHEDEDGFLSMAPNSVGPYTVAAVQQLIKDKTALESSLSMQKMMIDQLIGEIVKLSNRITTLEDGR